MKFEVIQNIPSPYRLHLFDEMWRQLKARGVEFHVSFMSEGHRQRPESWRHPRIDFPHDYWKDWGWRTHHFNVGLISYLRRQKTDILLVGSPFDTFTSILAAWFCPARIRCAWVEGQTKTPGKMNGFLGWFKRMVLSRYPYAGVPGADGRKYFEMHQALTRRKMPQTIYLPNLIDETRFKLRDDWSKDEIASLRLMLAKKENVRICLIPARLDAVKGLVEFVRLLTPEMTDGWRIVVMGQGPLKSEILETAKDQGISDRLMILDYVPYSEMPKYYAASDLFLLPSLHDPNPLSVVEALHTGLPVALTDRAGNVEEAVTEEVNGWRLPVLDCDMYRMALKRIFATPKTELERMGRISKEVNSAFWNTKQSVATFLDELIKGI